MTVDDDHAEVIAAVLAAREPAERRELLANALQRYGVDLLGSLLGAAADDVDDGRVMQLLGEAAELAADWIHGADVTGSAEEAERRKAVAEAMAAVIADDENDTRTEIGALLTRADALLALPTGHPDRDVRAALDLAERAWRAAREVDDAGAELAALYQLIALPDVDRSEFERLLAAFRGLQRRLPLEPRMTFLVQAGQVALGAAAGARRMRERADERAWLALAGSALRPLRRRWRARRPLSADQLLILATYSYARGRLAEAAALAQRAGDGGTLLAAQAAARLGRPDDAEVALRSFVGDARERYLQAVTDDEIERRGATMRMATATLAWALAAQGRWSEAVEVIEGAKSSRLRLRRELRDTPGGSRALELERALHAVTRGVPVALETPDDDPLGAGVTPRARLTEAYRQARRELAPAAQPAPGTAEIASVLEDDEAALVIGVTPVATLLALVLAGDGDEPSAHRVLEGWPFERWSWLVIGRSDVSWLSALAGVPGVDRARSLARLISGVEAALGRALSELLDGVGARRLVVIPHAALHLVPLWALPGLTDRDMLICPSASHLIAGRRAPARTGTAAVLVIDPTLDLPLSALEAAAIDRHLGGIRPLERAGEDDIRKALPGAWLLHVSGHGRLDIADPDSAGLLLSPTQGQAALAERARAAQTATSTRWTPGTPPWEVADVAALGRLSRRSLGGRTELRLDSGPTETLWMVLEDGQRPLTGELWSAGDIALEPSLAGTELAFLSACDSGATPASSGEESAGLVAALLLAGVRTIVSTLWPVTEDLAALAVDLFFESLAAAPSPAAVAPLTGALSRRLRSIERDDVCDRLFVLADRCSAPYVHFETEAAAARIAAGPRRPFAHPLHWAAFFASGAGIIDTHPARGGTARSAI